MRYETLFAALLCAVLLVVACGRKTAPEPQDLKNLFAWKSTQAEILPNGCLALTGEMSGATRNVDGFSLELEPLASSSDPNLPPELAALPDTCEGCPFTPRERSEIRPDRTFAKENAMRYTFTYCPAIRADAWRWRIVARNVFLTFPFAISQVQSVRKK